MTAVRIASSTMEAGGRGANIGDVEEPNAPLLAARVPEPTSGALGKKWRRGLVNGVVGAGFRQEVTPCCPEGVFLADDKNRCFHDKFPTRLETPLARSQFKKAMGTLWEHRFSLKSGLIAH
jgi:hypothetical protein